MAELSSDDGHRSASHSELRRVSMPQDMKGDGRRQPGRIARLFERALLMRRAPHTAVMTQEQMLIRIPATRPFCEAKRPLVGQRNVAEFAFAQSDRDRAAIRVEC